MTHKLQLEIDEDLTGDGKPEIAVTPIDIPISNEAADAFKQFVMLAGVAGGAPTSGEVDFHSHMAIPFHFSFINLKIQADMTIKLRVKDA